MSSIYNVPYEMAVELSLENECVHDSQTPKESSIRQCNVTLPYGTFHTAKFHMELHYIAVWNFLLAFVSNVHIRSLKKVLQPFHMVHCIWSSMYTAMCTSLTNENVFENVYMTHERECTRQCVHHSRTRMCLRMCT